MNQQDFFDRYSFNVRNDKIGGGSFGTVYRAYDNTRDREVAIKVSEVREMDGKEFSLQVEFKAIQDLPVHVNIAHYEEVFTFESPQGVFDYAVMQYYKEGNLSSFLENHPRLSLSEREGICMSILEGIAHLHVHKVVHRDLKPGNILMVRRKNGALVPKITDFGLSKKTSLDDNTRFEGSFAGGTPEYSSPEQIRGGKLRLNTDLWSFGVIAFEVLTGEQLFQVDGYSSASAEWQNQMTQRILKMNIGSRIKELPEKWKNALKVCLRREQEERVKSTSAIKDILLGLTEFQLPPQPKVSAFNGSNNPTKVRSGNKEREPEISPPLKKEKSKPTLAQFKWLLIFISVTFLTLFIYSLIPTEQELWDKAKLTNSFDDYENYLDKFPNGIWKNDAISNLFAYANQHKTIEIYESLLSKYPNKDAQISLDSLQLIKNNKAYNELISKGNNAFTVAKNYYQNREYNKSADSFIEAKKAFNKAIEDYDINDANAQKLIQSVLNQVDSYISSQEQDMRLNPSQKTLYSKNIKILKEILK